MAYKGTCLQTYIPLRKEANSDAEMLSSVVFGESYTITDESNGFLKIQLDYDQYVGWISKNTNSEYKEDFTSVIDHVFIEAKGDHQKLFIPCGGMVPENASIEIEGQVFKLERKLKTYHHLPLAIRIQKLASSFLNAPYIWGGRTFMGIDCSGLVQIVYKANGIFLPRDSYQQAEVGTRVEYASMKTGDLVFFSKPDAEKVVHVGMVIEKNTIIHSSGKVRIDTLHKDGLHVDGSLAYKLLHIQRVL